LIKRIIPEYLFDLEFLELLLSKVRFDTRTGVTVDKGQVFAGTKNNYLLSREGLEQRSLYPLG
jgi:hypothetical protein